MTPSERKPIILVADDSAAKQDELARILRVFPLGSGSRPASDIHASQDTLGTKYQIECGSTFMDIKRILLRETDRIKLVLLDMQMPTAPGNAIDPDAGLEVLRLLRNLQLQGVLSSQPFVQICTHYDRADLWQEHRNILRKESSQVLETVDYTDPSWRIFLEDALGRFVKQTQASRAADVHALKEKLALRAPVWDSLLERLIAEYDARRMMFYFRGGKGTGKSWLIRDFVEFLRIRRGSKLPFVEVSIREGEQDMDRELFGIEAGSYSSVTAENPGAFTRADTGFLLIDEIGNASRQLQLKLLNILDRIDCDGKVQVREMSKGWSETSEVSCRVVLASYQDPHQLEAEGKFDESFRARLTNITIPYEVPPLRDRREDILPLFVSCLEHRMKSGPGIRNIHLRERAREALQRFDYPENVRDLSGIAGDVYTYWNQSGPLVVDVSDVEGPIAQRREGKSAVRREWSEIAAAAQEPFLPYLRKTCLEMLNRWSMEQRAGSCQKKLVNELLLPVLAGTAYCRETNARGGREYARAGALLGVNDDRKGQLRKWIKAFEELEKSPNSVDRDGSKEKGE